MKGGEWKVVGLFAEVTGVGSKLDVLSHVLIVVFLPSWYFGRQGLKLERHSNTEGIAIAIVIEIPPSPPQSHRDSPSVVFFGDVELLEVER